MVIVLAIVCAPYILLFWWLKPITAMGYFGVFVLASAILLLLVIIIGLIHNYRSNRA
jgi:heme exporter protein D